MSIMSICCPELVFIAHHTGDIDPPEEFDMCMCMCYGYISTYVFHTSPAESKGIIR